MRALFSFLTPLPLREASLEGAARGAHLIPLVGLATGIPGATLILLGYVVPAGVAATLALGAVLLAAGLHHSDGVLDVGDALMVRGDPQRRRAVLKDARVGVGGICALFIVYAPTLAALAAFVEVSPASAALALLCAEVCDRCTMLLVLAFGRPAEETSSSAPFVRALKGPRKTVGVILALAAPIPLALPFDALAPLVVLLLLAAATCFSLRVSRSAFGGISGDIVGAAGEVGRAVVLVALTAF